MPEISNLPQSLPFQREVQAKRSGLNFLKERSRLALKLKSAPPLSSILIIDDNQGEAERIAVMIRLVLGPDVLIPSVRRLSDARKEIESRMPDVIFLDDRLGHAVSAETSVAQLKNWGVVRPPVILSGMLTRVRLIELKKLGVGDVIHKDDIDASRIMRAILRALGLEPGDQEILPPG